LQTPSALTTCAKAGKAATAKKRKASTSEPRRGRAGANKSWLLIVETREKMGLV